MVSVQFDVPQQDAPNKGVYAAENLDLAYKFSGKLVKEFGTFVRAIALFGSTARKEQQSHDIDILVVVDDTTIVVTPEISEAYRVIVEKTIADTSTKLHVTTLRFTTFWEYMRAGDPVGINILREAHIILDSGFFRPMQALLVQGRIRPSAESIWSYFSHANKSLTNSRWNLLQASLDLYWAVIDSAHAALMKAGEVPPAPSHVAKSLHDHLEKKNLIPKNSSHTMEKFYKLMKSITHRELKDMHGKEYEEYYKQAHMFVQNMKKYIEQK